MDTQKLYDLIDKVIGKKGSLRTPAYWMRRVLNSIVDFTAKVYADLGSAIKQLKSEQNSKIDSLSSRISYLEASERYLCFVALEDGLRIQFSTTYYLTCEYSLDLLTWHPLGFDEYAYTPAINKGERIWFKRVVTAAIGETGSGIFHADQDCEVEGNIMSMLYGDKATRYSPMMPHAFVSFFGDQFIKIKDASRLIFPNVELASGCYKRMFYKSDIRRAPIIQGTKLTTECFMQMFAGCYYLTAAPELPFTELSKSCYNEMFFGCTSLVNAPELPATTLAESCYANMFNGCTALQKAPTISAQVLAPDCCYGMFVNCTRLIEAPALYANNAEYRCYCRMFFGCTSLVNAPELPATSLATACYQSMFSGCTSLVNAPELPATTLAEYGYNEMFNGCSKLAYIKAMFITLSFAYDHYTHNWLKGVAPTGTFVKNAAATWDVTGPHGVPEGWTVETVEVVDNA